MKTFNELVKKLSKKDNTPVERLELSKVRSTLEEQCEKYLVDTDDIYQFEALPSAINFIIVDFPEPVSPTKAIFEFSFTLMFIFFNICFSP